MIGSVCSGYAGLDTAVAEVLGGEVAWFVEFADAPARLLAHHWPTVPNHRDVTLLDWSTVTPVEVFCGGYPCQNWSLAGKRLGAADERHVWPYLAKGPTNPPADDDNHNPDLPAGAILRPGALAVLRPRLAVFENVAGHLSLGFDEVLADLHELGYDAWWTLWNASDEGAPHRRRRLFVLAVRRDRAVPVPRGGVLVARREDGWVGPDEGLFGAVPFTGPIPPTGTQIGGSVYALPAPSGGRRTGLLPTPRTTDANGAGVHGSGGMDLRTAVTLLPTPTATPYGNNQSASPGAAVRPSLDSLASSAEASWGVYGPAIRLWERLLDRDAPARTMTGARGGRQLSPAFVEWMQGLLAGHVTGVPGLSRSEQLKMLGNGVVVQQAAAALRWLAGMALWQERAA